MYDLCSIPHRSRRVRNNNWFAVLPYERLYVHETIIETIILLKFLSSAFALHVICVCYFKIYQYFCSVSKMIYLVLKQMLKQSILSSEFRYMSRSSCEGLWERPHESFWGLNPAPFGWESNTLNIGLPRPQSPLKIPPPP
jgi:hypothetical protein